MKARCRCCGKVVKIYSKGLCSVCYQREFRRKRFAENIEYIKSLDGEIWKDVSGYEGLYMVSNLGRVKRKAVFRTNSKERICKPQTDKDGYLKVALSKDGAIKLYSVHRLVANEFIPNPLKKPQVNHIDGNKQNDKVENLEWCTPSENILHRVYVLKGKSVKPIKKVKCIETNIVYEGVRDAARKIGCPHSNICMQISGKIKHCKGLHFTYDVQ